MKISKDSWHFKLVNFFSGDQYAYRIERGRVSNCQHIRKTLFSVLMSFLMSFLMLAAISLLVFILFIGYIALPLWAVFDVQFFDLSEKGIGWFRDTLSLAIIVDSLTVIFGLFFTAKHFIYKWAKNRKPKVKVVKPDGFVTSYLKAKNEKICTRVEFVEGEK
jgi:uncharacterized BrkB/YihY/UPF0761 family membrane protein